MKKNQIAILSLITIMLALVATSTLTPVKSQLTHGVITISFDDSKQNQFDYAYPLMKARGIVGTFYAITDSISDFSGDNAFMSINELQILQANGNEIGSHSITHPHFTQLTEEQIREECSISKNVLQSHGLSAINFAYPYGDRNGSTDEIVSQYYRSGRPSWSSYTTSLPVTTWLIIGTTGETGQSDVLSYLQNFVDQVYASNEWGVIYFHNVVPHATDDPYSISQQDFESFLNYVIYKEIPTVTVNQALDLITPPIIPLSVSINPTSTSMEIGQSQTFTSTVTGDTSPYSYQWYLNNTPVTGATNPTWTFTPTQTGQYNIHLKVTDNQDYQAQSNTITDITIYNQTSVSINAVSTRMHIGESQTFTSTVTGDNQPYSYQWYCNNTKVTGATDSTWTFTANQAERFDIYLKVTDNLNYQTQSNIMRDITVYNRLSVSIDPTSTSMEIGQSQTFTSTVTGDTSPYSYQWYLNNTPVTGATNPTWTFTPTQTGQYNIHLKVTDNQDYQAQSNTITDITIYNQTSVTICPATVYLAVQQSQTFTSKVTGGIGPYTFQWYQNGTAIPGANSNTLTLTPNTAGKFIIYLEVTDNSAAIVQSNNVTVEATLAPKTLANQGDGNLFFENWGLYMLAGLLVMFTFTARIIHGKSLSKK